MRNLMLAKKQKAQTKVFYTGCANFAVTIFSPDSRFYLGEISGNIRIQNSTRLFELKCYDLEQLMQDINRQVSLILNCESPVFHIEELCYIVDVTENICHHLMITISDTNYNPDGYLKPDGCPGYKWLRSGK